MTDSLSGQARPRIRGYAPVLLTVLSVVALCVYLFLLRQSPQQDRSPLLPLFAFCLVLGAGICVGRWWPRRSAAEAPLAEVQADPESMSASAPEPQVLVDEPKLEKISALADEEHIVIVSGDSAPDMADDDAAEEAPTDAHTDAGTAVAVAQPVLETTPQPDEQPDEQPFVDAAAGGPDVDIPPPASPAQIQPPQTEALPTEAAQIETSKSVAIEQATLDAALAAKDEMIESLENIVKENRDRWSDFEVQRDALDTKIQRLEEELRIASQIIEGSRDADDDYSLERPQVLSRA